MSTLTPEQKQTYKVWRWRVFAATWLSYAGFYFARKPFSIVKADLGDSLNWSATDLGMLGAAYLIAYTIGQFLSGGAGQRFGPRIILLGGMAVSVAANALMGFSNSFGSFMVLMSLNGLAQSTGWSNNVGTMGHWFHRHERGKVMGIWATNYQVGGVLANTLAAYILGKYGFQYSFFAGSVVLMVVWAFVLFNQRNRPEDVGLPTMDDLEDGDGDEESSPEEDVGWPREVVINIFIVGCFYLFVKFIRYALWSWAPYLLQKNYGLEGDDAGYISTVFDVAGIVGVIICGYLSDKLFEGKRAKIAFIFMVGMAISCVLLYTAGQASVLMFAVSMGFIGFTLYGPDALMTGAGAIDVGSAKRATMAAGIVNGMGSIGAVLQEFVLGSMLESGSVGLVFATLLTSAVLGAICLSALLYRGKQGKCDI